ncbi:MAG: type IV pilus assembly protein PilM [Planctomycetota bacterium]
MAKSNAGVWGIEIGQTAIKALHCVADGDDISVDAFDYIEYPKILSQPEADPDELVAEGLETLLQRNDSLNDQVVISVPGQSGLAKFFKPPPVELKKMADIVRYEARQQIPFDLDDVVWDYQLMPGSMIEEGFAAESEVGLFAMKREQAYRQLAPFDRADIEVDQVQLAPIALYNMLVFDRMHERLEADIFDPDDPPPSTVLLSIGTDSSDLIVTNGFRIWQRSMPIGGNHFTRQLTKDLKMTFAKAEHLKRNVREAVDPKLVIQTMRPVFNDLETEIQRSIGFFRSIDKKAEIGEMLVTGNTVKMPGLAAYLGKNLGFDVEVVDRFNRLGGEDVMAIPAFRDNLPTFAVCYGLCLQGLKKSQITNSLIPQEIKTARLIRAKKPWTLAALSTLLIGMSVNYAFTEQSWKDTHEDHWGSASGAVQTTTSLSSSHKSEDETRKTQLEYLDRVGVEVASNSTRRQRWLEIYRIINELIPRVDSPDGTILTPAEKPYPDRKDIFVTQIDAKQYDDLKTWFSDKLKGIFQTEIRSWATLMGVEIPEELKDVTGPTEGGWVFQLDCHHYFNDPDRKDSNRIGLVGADHVKRSILHAFLTKKVKVPVGVDGDGNPKYEEFSLEEYGIEYPIMINGVLDENYKVTNPDFDPTTVPSTVGQGSEDDLPLTARPMLDAPRFNFKFQFVLKERTMEERNKLRTENEEKAKVAAEKAAAEAAASGEA